VQKRRLKAKYRRRRRNRTKQILHVVSKEIASILSREKVEPVFEDLLGIRESMRSKRRTGNGRALRRDMRRRLNQWPFRKLQSYAEYKTLAQGYGSHYLSHDQVRGTSSTCPVCGAWSKPNGRVFTCKACGYTAERHFVGAYNIAVRWWTTKDVGSSVPPEWRQMQPRVEVAVPPAKLEAKTQRTPVLQFATEF
jgi:IS605 OrfB family transposase